MAMYLAPRRVLSPVEWDHITMVSRSHIEACEHLGFVVVQVSGISQLVRDMGKERRRSSLTTRGRRWTRGWHCVVISK